MIIFIFRSPDGRDMLKSMDKHSEHLFRSKDSLFEAQSSVALS